MQKYTDILKQYWGYDQFRAMQGDIIQSIASGRDTLGLLPTGGGKSITFQVPALAMEGVCVVVTPLIALMKDQVENLKNKGIAAASIHAGLSRDEVKLVLENCVFNAYKFLYVSPERLSTALFLEKIKQTDVCLFAIDESHCISQWGYDFRPSYLKIAEIRSFFPEVPVLALTATATPEVVDDIQEKLAFREKNVFRKSFNRSNLAYVVRNTENKEQQLVNILQKVPGSSVVYVRNRKRTKEIADMLKEKGITAEYYHAGLSSDIKDARQARWKSDETRVIVSTNAFGMGIDKPEVRTVVHLDVPDSMEAYFQEAGRAGRDEKKAFAIMLYGKSDLTKLKKRISDSFPEKEFIARVYQALGNYYQIAVGSALDRTFPFDLSDFCSLFKLPMLMVHHALNILQYAGYVELSDEQDNQSRVMFLLQKDDLYDMGLTAELDSLIHILLRSYTGLFAEPAYVQEELLAKRLGSTADKVYQGLVTLSREKIIQYIPRKRTPFISYIHERVDNRHLQITPAAYEIRKERYEGKILSMMNYLTDKSQCRSKMLLAYFGEKEAPACGQCDVCLNQNSRQIPDGKFTGIEKKILMLLQKTALTPLELCRKMYESETEILEVVRQMIDRALLSYDSRGKLKRSSE